ncbi:MAG: hypothetical protein J5I92_12645 [Thiogranum sp.]|nr:hypothetical protein [Thiogranum sp.]
MVPAGKWSVYFQQGKALSFGGIDEYLPYCELQVTGPAKQLQIIEPGEFLIVRVREDISGVQSGVTTVAFGGTRLTGVFEKEFGSYETVMELRADTHPEITRLRCARVDEVPVGVFLSLTEIRTALGELATLEISGPAMQHDAR